MSLKMVESNIQVYYFDIQRFSVHDGPGIRTVVFTKGCPLACVWCQNPESQKYKPEVAFYTETCTNCNICIAICPENAINTETKIANYSLCKSCNKCVENCENEARKMIGQKAETDKIVSDILKDYDFYIDSNGGVTFSGGEPFIFPEFLFDIFKILSEKNIHITVETCGQFTLKKVTELLPYINLIFFDIKHINPEKHKKYTGVRNEIILNNFENINKVFKNIQVRMPLIPGFNDDFEHIKILSEYLIKNNHRSIHLLPFHKLGNSKAIRINRKNDIFAAKLHTAEELEEIKSYFKKFEISPVIYD